jgi:RHS repeat-associated protein
VTGVLGDVYGYAPDNKRVYKKVGANEEVYFWGVGGERLGVYAPRTSNGTPYFEKMTTWKYFAGRRLQMQDRLGSVATGSRYYPYGEEGTPTANNTDKFATYWRDATGLDYADQRYYASTRGRFLEVDPGPHDPVNPQSWNRYSYAWNDPVNLVDRDGRLPANADLCF